MVTWNNMNHLIKVVWKFQLQVNFAFNNKYMNYPYKTTFFSIRIKSRLILNSEFKGMSLYWDAS